MTQLIRYEAACRAIAEAKSVDEVKDIANKATAMKLYARQAKNKQLEVDAAEIRLRAERHIGELMEAQRCAGLMASAGRRSDKIGLDENPIPKNPSLAEVGIDKSLANRARKLAAVPCEKFEQHIGAWRDRVSQEGERVSMALIAEGTKAERRARREAELAGKQRALPDKKYGVIYADHPNGTADYAVVMTKCRPHKGALKAAWRKGSVTSDGAEINRAMAGEDEEMIVALAEGHHRTRRGCYDLLLRALKACGMEERQ